MPKSKFLSGFTNEINAPNNSISSIEEEFNFNDLAKQLTEIAIANPGLTYSIIPHVIYELRVACQRDKE